ncbi:MAG: PEGA domain-containing protein [Pirellulaceae bacterium]
MPSECRTSIALLKPTMPLGRYILPRKPLLLLFLCALAVLSSGGCVRRRMTIRTNPPGAQVFVDDQEIGTTPCSSAYVYYGTRKVTVIKDGYKTETLYHKFSPPWYQIPPLDFITENLFSREIRDERIIDVTLAPQEIVPEAALRERAEGLRRDAQGRQYMPLIPAAATQKPNATVTELPAETGYPGQGLNLFQPAGAPEPLTPKVP